jgi:hypothetical protein
MADSTRGWAEIDVSTRIIMHVSNAKLKQVKEKNHLKYYFIGIVNDATFSASPVKAYEHS